MNSLNNKAFSKWNPLLNLDKLSYNQPHLLWNETMLFPFDLERAHIPLPMPFLHRLQIWYKLLLIENESRVKLQIKWAELHHQLFSFFLQIEPQMFLVFKWFKPEITACIARMCWSVRSWAWPKNCAIVEPVWSVWLARIAQMFDLVQLKAGRRPDRAEQTAWRPWPQMVFRNTGPLFW